MNKRNKRHRRMLVLQKQSAAHYVQTAPADDVKEPVTQTSREEITSNQGKRNEPCGATELKATHVPPSSASDRPAQDKAAEARTKSEWDVGDVILGLYEIIQVHKGGGMGLVYRVHHRAWDVDMAVKSPRAECFQTTAQKETFSGECETWTKLGTHPNIVTCHYVRTLEGLPRVFAEYVEGGTLKDWIDTKKLYVGSPTDALKRILDVAIQFAEGLNFAHEQGMVHQDIKPANVMMTPEGIAKVTDFGLARTTGGMTPAYCSPEQANADAAWRTGKDASEIPKLTRSTDIWSWAVSILEMFTGGIFWTSGQAAPDVLSACLQEGPENPAIPRIPDKLSQLLGQCFLQDPGQRPDSMAAVTRTLKDVYRECFGENYPRIEPKAVEFRGGGGLNNQAIVMLDLGRHDKAEELLQQALAQAPCHPAATYNLWTHLWRTGRATDEQVVSKLTAVTRVYPDDWHAAYLLGLVHMQRGDAESAAIVLKAAIDRNPNNVDKSLTSLLSAARRLGDLKWQQLKVPLKHAHNKAKQFSWLAYRPGSDECLVSAGFTPCAVSAAATLITHQSQPSRESAIQGLEANKVVGNRATMTRLPRSPEETLNGCFQFLRSLSGKRFTEDEVADVIAETRCWAREVDRSYSWFGRSNDSRNTEEQLLSQLNEVYLWGEKMMQQFEEERKGLQAWETKARAHLERPEASITTIAGIPNEHAVITGHLDGTVALWNEPNNSFASVRWWFSGGGSAITHLTLDADGKKVLSASENGNVMLWDIKEAKQIAGWEFKAGIGATALLRDGARALIAGKDGTLLLFDLETASCVWGMNNGAMLRCIALAGSGEKAVTGDDAGFVKVWDLATGQCVDQLRADEKAVLHVAVAQDCKWYWSASSDGRVRLWQASTGICMRTDRLNIAPQALTLSNTGNDIGLALEDAYLLRHVHYPTDWFCLSCPTRLLSASEDIAARRQHATLLGKAEIALNNRRIAEAIRFCEEATQVEGCTYTAEGRALWAKLSGLGARVGIRQVRPTKILNAHEGPVEALTLAYDGDVFSQGRDGYIYSWKSQGAGDLILNKQELKGARSLLRALRLSSDGRLAVIDCATEKAAVLCSTVDEEPKWGRISYGTDIINAQTVSVHGRVALAGRDCVRIYASDQNFEREVKCDFLDEILALEFSGNGRCLLVCGHKGEEAAAALWNLEAGHWGAKILSSTRSAPSANGLSWYFSPDGRMMIVASVDRHLEMWDAASGGLVRKFHDGVTNVPHWVVMTPDARFVAAGGREGFAGIWDASTGKLLNSMLGPDCDATSAVWLADGCHIALGYANGEIWIWEIEWDVLPEPPGTWRQDVGPIIKCFLASQKAREHPTTEAGEVPAEAPARDISNGAAPKWTEADFDYLKQKTACWGYGAVTPEEFRNELQRLTVEWHRNP